VTAHSQADARPTWHSALVQREATVQAAIESMNASAMQIALVVDGAQTLIGTVTDGDIRRGLIAGGSLTCPVESVVNRDALVVPPSLDRELVLHLMRANHIHQLPIVDVDRRVVGLHLLDDLVKPERRANAMVVMAGGQGTRLRPHTENCPKPLLKVNGKPMLEHIIERAKADGLSRFVISIHYLGHMIEEYFGDGSRWEVEIQYLREQKPLGTAGAIGLMVDRPTEALIVSNGDIITNIGYREILAFHAVHRAAATMAVRPHEWQQPYGVVNTNGVDIVGFEEKPIVRSQVNAGIYVLSPEVFGFLNPDERCDMPTLFQRLQASGMRTIVYPMHEPWMDVAKPRDLAQANGVHSDL
jgi:dTDP-glucose pyrophosphorylase/CBS domain-containing protein